VIWTAFTDLEPVPHKWALACVCFSFFFLYYFFASDYVC